MKDIVLLSGGIDSSTCLAVALQESSPNDVLAINIYYGQKHEREMRSAREIAEYYGVELMELDLSIIFSKSDCSLLHNSVHTIPHESYAEQQKKTHGGPVSTYVPFRNGLMLSAAASIAMSIGAKHVYYGAHADDAAGNAYPDCSIAFTDAINRAINEGTAGNISIMAPFISLNKAKVVQIGLKLGVPYQKTWSCYEGGEKPCCTCGTCIDRLNAFQANGIEDPLLN